MRGTRRSNGKKRRWIVVRIASRGRSWGAAQRNLVVKARTLGRAVAKALTKAEVDLKFGTGLTLVIELDTLGGGYRPEGTSTPPVASGEAAESNCCSGTGGDHEV